MNAEAQLISGARENIIRAKESAANRGRGDIDGWLTMALWWIQKAIEAEGDPKPNTVYPHRGD